MTQLLFLDEAGTPGASGFVIGGIAVDADRWKVHADRFVGEFPKVTTIPTAEIKWKSTRGLEGKAGRLLTMLRDTNAKAFAVVIEPKTSRRLEPELFATREAEYATALTFVAERFQRLLERTGSQGFVILDERGPTLDEQLRRTFTGLLHEGTPFVMLDRLIAPLLLTPSHHALGIQAADMIVGPIHTITRTDRRHVSAQRRATAWRAHERVRPLFDRHPQTRELRGVGLKIFPEPEHGYVRPVGRTTDRRVAIMKNS